jgi:hypothetical protein
MRRTAIAAAWLLGATIPLLAAVVMLFGCCVLPFHHVIHKAMPFCNVAMDVLRSANHSHHGSQQSGPAHEKQEPVKRVATALPRSLPLTRATISRRGVALDSTAYRSFIALGALRCDQDIGLHLLVVTLLI